MRTARVLTGGALTVTALGLAGASALAGDFGKLEVNPSPAQPATQVTVNTTACGMDGTGTGDASAVGGPASFPLRPATHKEVVVGQFTVPDKAKPGTYGIGVKCHNGKEATGDLTVSSGSGTGTGAGPGTGINTSTAPSPAMSGAGTPTGMTKPPKGGVKTGVGSTSENSGLPEIMAGAALLATAAAGGTWYLRRRT
ncbi:hypothetical protein [Streptomyces sp. UNOC14_S4]|uniref:hypothetical protein n=1 Tax=Streptomyces sp. UNOC14_S4 TaxID=2872340 RepID=UPI001E45CB09|nr:hypothetical protein [Streptomyces sp. UNOC14_S4]MCC3772935.1 hypothetical protein [Streptomyces sp. UNOC14_S4]